jgi:tRNA U34 5-carboxymethylaminomethyl modifying GTPase MnmE/TrmE
VHPSFRIVSVEAADVKVCIISLTELLDKLEKDEPGLNTMSASLVDSDTIFVLNKTDLVNMTPQLRARISSALGVEDNQDKEVSSRLLFVSVEKRSGLAELSERLRTLVEEK